MKNRKKKYIGTNEKAVENEKLEPQLQEIHKEKHTKFLDLKRNEEQADQINLLQRNKSNECINSAQINSQFISQIKQINTM